MALTRLNSRILKQLNLGLVSVKRTFLSDSFDMKVEWNDRLKAPIFGVIDMEKYFLDIDRQFNITGLASHIDLDIFANALLLSKNDGIISNTQDIETRFEQIEELLRRFRTTSEAVKMLDSTPHAVVRNAVDVKQTDILMKLLENRLKYGLILDDFTNTFLINKMLKDQNYRDASKSAILMMLQEEYDIPIAKNMATYAIFMYINHMKTETELLPWDPLPEEVIPEPEDEVKVRVEEIENPDFDDHFDIVKKEHLLGKTLAKMASQGIKDSFLNNSLQLLGYTFYEKWDKVSEIINKNKEFDQECIENALHYVNTLENVEIENQLKNLKGVRIGIAGNLKSKIDEAVSKHEENYVKKQTEVYNQWNLKREEDLEAQKENFEKQSKLQEIEQTKVKLDEKEKKLFFFDNYYDMEREKRARIIAWRKRFPSKTGKTWGTPIKMGLKSKQEPHISRVDQLNAKRKEIWSHKQGKFVKNEKL